jgi:hypothetical protein
MLRCYQAEAPRALLTFLAAEESHINTAVLSLSTSRRNFVHYLELALTFTEVVV